MKNCCNFIQFITLTLTNLFLENSVGGIEMMEYWNPTACVISVDGQNWINVIKSCQTNWRVCSHDNMWRFCGIFQLNNVGGQNHWVVSFLLHHVTRNGFYFKLHRIDLEVSPEPTVSALAEALLLPFVSIDIARDDWCSKLIMHKYIGTTTYLTAAS